MTAHVAISRELVALMSPSVNTRMVEASNPLIAGLFLCRPGVRALTTSPRGWVPQCATYPKYQHSTPQTQCLECRRKQIASRRLYLCELTRIPKGVCRHYRIHGGYLVAPQAD